MFLERDTLDDIQRGGEIVAIVASVLSVLLFIGLCYWCCNEKEVTMPSTPSTPVRTRPMVAMPLEDFEAILARARANQ